VRKFISKLNLLLVNQIKIKIEMMT